MGILKGCKDTGKDGKDRGREDKGKMGQGSYLRKSRLSRNVLNITDTNSGKRNCRMVPAHLFLGHISLKQRPAEFHNLLSQ